MSDIILIAATIYVIKNIIGLAIALPLVVMIGVEYSREMIGNWKRNRK